MIKLFSLKQQKKDAEGSHSNHKKASAAQLRITKGEHFRLNFPFHIVL